MGQTPAQRNHKGSHTTAGHSALKMTTAPPL